MNVKELRDALEEPDDGVDADLTNDTFHFEIYQDHCLIMPNTKEPAWRFRGVVVDDIGTSAERVRTVLVTWWEYETREEAAQGAKNMAQWLYRDGESWVFDPESQIVVKFLKRG